MMIVSVNGQDRELPEGATVLDLLNALGLGAVPVVVQRNDDILDRESFRETALAAGDRIELIRLVGGG